MHECMLILSLHAFICAVDGSKRWSDLILRNLGSLKYPSFAAAAALLTSLCFNSPVRAEEDAAVDVFVNPQTLPPEQSAPRSGSRDRKPLPVSNRAPLADEKPQETADDNKQPGGQAGPATVEKGYHLSLESAIEIAVLNNLGLKIARLNDRGSDINVKTAWARYYPDFNVGVNHSNSRLSGQNAGDGATTVSGGVTQRSPWGTQLDFALSETRTKFDTDRATGDARVAVTQPLWKGAGTDVGLNEIRTARINRLISRGQLDLQTQTLIFNVRQAYANVISAIQNRVVNEQSVRSARTFLELSDAREKAGQVTKLDVFNADVQLRNRELDLLRTQRQLEIQLDILKQLMDIDLEERLIVDATEVDFGDPPTPENRANVAPPEPDSRKEVTSDENSGTVALVQMKSDKPAGPAKVLFQATHFDEPLILKEALDNRIDLLNAHRGLAIQKLQAMLAKDGLGHQIDLSGSYDRANAGRSLLESDNGREVGTWTVGVNASFPWGKIRDRAAYERALLELQRVEIELKQVRTQVQFDIRDNLRELRQLEKTVLVDARKVEAAKRSVEAAQISFDRGLKDSFDVIRAQDDLLSAKVAFINDSVGYVVSLAKLERNVGKPTGRVNLEGQSLGGLIDAKIPDEIKAKGMPMPQPEPEARPEDDPLNKTRQYRKDYKVSKEPVIIDEK
jgi:outer membrane protein TolC